MWKSIVTSTAAALLLCSNAVADDWTLDSKRSTLHFVSVKNDTIAETHRFTELTGAINDGELKVTIPVASIDTAIPIRNERMLKHLFNAEEYTNVTATASIPTSIYDLETATGTLPVIVSIEVFIAGEAVEVNAALQVTKVSADHLVATTSRPILINANDFALVEGINKLQEIAGLQAIDQVIPVTFSVQFSRDN